MACPDDEGSGAFPQFVVGVQPPEDDVLDYVVHGLNEGISNADERRDRVGFEWRSPELALPRGDAPASR